MRMNEMKQKVTEVLTGWLCDCFNTAFPGQEDSFSGIHVVPSVNREFGDFQCNAAMGLARVLKMAPRAIAEAVVADVTLPEMLSDLQIAGPGFINITLNSAWLARYVESLSEDDQLGVPQAGSGRTVVVDYSCPNIAKPMHVGHIRSTVIGNALDRIYRALGFRVVSDNHLGDWGTQFGIIIMGYRHFLDSDALQKSPVEELERIYVKSYEMTKEDPEWLDKCRAELVKLQKGDPENIALWNEFIKLSMSEFEKIYARLDVNFDLVRGESFYNDALPGVIKRLEDKGLAQESEGATVVNLEDEDLRVCIVRKSDGGFNYATTDIATVLRRDEEFQPEKIVYVTDERQQLHFRQFFSICGKLGVKAELKHVWFGLMRLPEGAFSTRQGNVIKLEALLDEAERRSLAVIEQSSPEMSDEQKRALARDMGIGAVKYADLSQNPQTMITFTWEKAMALDGNSGPYLQYAHARICSVRDKYADSFADTNADAEPLLLGEPIEKQLALKILQFGDAVQRSADQYKPSALADYLYELCQLYSTFYQTVPFLKAEPGVRESRIRLCGVVASVLKRGLGLLGIAAPERV